MPELKNPRWEKFAQVYFLTGNASEAYRQCNGRGLDIDSNGWRYARKNEIVARVAELKQQASRKSTLSREQLINNLVEMITSPPSAASLDNPLCEIRYYGKEAEPRAQFPDRPKCMELLSKLCGWQEPEKIQISIDPLQSLLDSIRSRAIELHSVKQLPGP